MKHYTACALCRAHARKTRHHLTPRPYRPVAEANSKTVLLCALCHAEVHRVFTAQELAETWNTRAKLQEAFADGTMLARGMDMDRIERQAKILALHPQSQRKVKLARVMKLAGCVEVTTPFGGIVKLTRDQFGRMNAGAGRFWARWRNGKEKRARAVELNTIRKQLRKML